MSNQYRNRPRLNEALNLTNNARVNMAKLYSLIVKSDPCGIVTLNAVDAIRTVDEFFHDVKVIHLDNCKGAPEMVIKATHTIKSNSLINILGEVHNSLVNASVLIWNEIGNENIKHQYDCEVRVELGNLFEQITDIMDEDEEPTPVQSLGEAIENATEWLG